MGRREVEGEWDAESRIEGRVRLETGTVVERSVVPGLSCLGPLIVGLPSRSWLACPGVPAPQVEA